MWSLTHSQSSPESLAYLSQHGNQPYSTILLTSTTGLWWIRSEGVGTFESKSCILRLIYLEQPHRPILMALCLQEHGIKDLSPELSLFIQVKGRTAILSKKSDHLSLDDFTVDLAPTSRQLLRYLVRCHLPPKQQKQYAPGLKVAVNLSLLRPDFYITILDG